MGRADDSFYAPAFFVGHKFCGAVGLLLPVIDSRYKVAVYVGFEEQMLLFLRFLFEQIEHRTIMNEIA